MACWTITIAGQSAEEREREIDRAVDALEEKLDRGEVTVTVGPQGAAALVGWADRERGGVADTCAIRTLTLKGSWALKQALQRAETRAGRKVDMQTINAGVHSHDGGKSWGTH